MAPQRKFSKAWNEEFEVMKEMQEDRMHMHANFTCHERCVSHYMTNQLLLNEKSCMENCFSKHSQAGIVTNLNYAKFEELEAQLAARKRK